MPEGRGLHAEDLIRKDDTTVWKYLIAIVLVAHGVGQILPFLAAWTDEKIFSDAAWLFSSGVGIRTPIGQAFALLGLLALMGFVGGALAFLFGQEWWPPILISASILSLIVAIPWAAAWPIGSLIGNVLVDVVVLVALLTPWGSRLAHAS
jgi:hypothetical protein